MTNGSTKQKKVRPTSIEKHEDDMNYATSFWWMAGSAGSGLLAFLVNQAFNLELGWWIVGIGLLGGLLIMGLATSAVENAYKKQVKKQGGEFRDYRPEGLPLFHPERERWYRRHGRAERSRRAAPYQLGTVIFVVVVILLFMAFGD